MLDIIHKSKEEVNQMEEVFVSYHFTSLDLKYNGFGNYVGKFSMEVYQGNKAQFILDLEKSISMRLGDELDMEVTIKVLYFR